MQPARTEAVSGLDAIRDGFKLSVVIPVYNELRWIEEVVRRVEAVPIRKEIILVDDASTDGTRDLLCRLEGRPGLCVLYQPGNRGKGAAVRRGFTQATGDVVLVQDADLEYDPADFPRLLRPILDNRADVVYGSRFLGTNKGGFSFRQYVANRLLTTLSNLFTRLPMTDMETGYKVFRRQVLADLRLQSDRFGFDPEVTVKLAKRQPPWRICEVPVSYHRRTYAQGKKIRLCDGIIALYSIVRFRLLD